MAGTNHNALTRRSLLAGVSGVRRLNISLDTLSRV